MCLTIHRYKYVIITIDLNFSIKRLSGAACFRLQSLTDYVCHPYSHRYAFYSRRIGGKKKFTLLKSYFQKKKNRIYDRGDHFVDIRRWDDKVLRRIIL